MNWDKIHTIYFLGIGGIGMSALARYFLHNRKRVVGYDRTPSPITDELNKLGAEIHFDDNFTKIPPNTDLVIYTPAVPKYTQIYKFAQRYFPLKKRAEILGEISKGLFTIAIAGTHGKTTISSLVTHILKYNHKQVIGFVGGIMKNYQSNLVLSASEKILVVEADEYDRSFLHLHPNIAVVTATDADHLDIYKTPEELQKSFQEFVHLLPPDGVLIHKKNVLEHAIDKNIIRKSYHLQHKANYHALNIAIKDGKFVFDIQIDGKELEQGWQSSLPGYHNIENILAAVAVCVQLGLQLRQIKQALENYQGVKRRFEYIIDKKDFVFIDDYAHHPQEIASVVKSVRDLYPNKTITGVFQPHLYSRTRDFARDFAKSLEPLDQIWLLDIYPARELPIEGVSSDLIFQQIQNPNKKQITKKELLNKAHKTNIGDVLLTMGAGDIDRIIEPLRQKLENEN